METRYGIYYIPPSESTFYQAGSYILGYDIRQQTVYPNHPLFNQRPRLDCGSAFYFGFHATIRGTFKTNVLSELDNNLSSIFAQQKPIILANSFISSLNPQSWAVLFSPDSEAAQMLYKLHADVVFAVDEYRQKDYISPETEAILDSLDEQEKSLLEKHGDPRVLAGYIFHFTLLNNAAVECLPLFDEMLAGYKMGLFRQSINIDTLCLVRQEGNNPYWRIAKEYIFPK